MSAARRWSFLGLCWAAWLPARRADGDFMCQCEFKDNNWIYYMSDLLTHVQNLPEVLQDPQHPATAWVMRQRCEEDASLFPNTDLALDIGDLLKLQQAANLQPGGRMEAHHMCLPGQVAMAMVCSQQWLVKGSTMGIVKWVSKMNELLGVAASCMDADSPLPLRRAEFEKYIGIFQQGIPKPDTPGFVSAFAFPFNARRKQTEEAAVPVHECLPMKDPSCFPRSTLNALESCTECCSPSKGPTGDANCWVGEFTFERCCNAAARPAAAAAPSQGCTGQDERNRELQKSLEQQVAESKEQGRLLANSKEDLRVCTKQLEQAQKGGAEKESRIAGLEQKLQEAAGAQEAKSAAACEESQKELEKLRSTVSDLESKLKQKEQEQASGTKKLEEQVKSLQAELKKASESSGGKPQEQIQNLQAELKKAKDAASKPQEQIESLQNELRKAQAAASGSCPAGGGAMLRRKPKDGACEDENELCQEWAASGMCQEMSEYMADVCCQSCKGNNNKKKA